MKMCENYLISIHEEDILRILEDPDKDKYFSVNINFLELFESDTNLGNALLTDPEHSFKNWNEAVFNVQNNLIKKLDRKYTLKNNVNCRIYSLPPWPHVCRTVFPGNDDADKFLQVTGTVVRMSARKLLEYQRQYVCTKCKYPITVEAKYDKRHIIKQPKKCTNPEGCTGKNIITFGELDSYNCKDYQEIKIQEDLSKMGVGSVPGHMVVTLEEDLVNVCKPGENVTITGIVKRRWSEFDKGVKITVDIVLKANHIQVNNSSGLSIAVSDDMRQFFDSYWMKYQHDPLVGRNIILKSISPEIYGRPLVKLAIAIVLAGGSSNENSQISTGIDTRSESHLLLVGDPGTGKSQMLRFASKIMPRSVLTTGIGSTAAGLTVTAIMENGEWQLEAGALVMADGGICCIDEFNSMREHDRTSIHEAMEQQTISVAKAGIVCKLKTRCSILAACNPKGNIDPSQPLCVNVAMSSPLLSRFDLILLLRDIVNEENDRKLTEYLLNKICDLSGEGVFWSLEKLQAYYAVIKKESPKLTAESETILSTYYQLQRKFGSRNKSRTTVRLLESLIRLSQGHAKLIYHSEVQVIDTLFAIILVDAALDCESSLLNLNIDYDSFFENPEQMYWDLLENILGKLNLDYIYQREVEKMGINIKKSSQNTSIDVSDQEDDTNLRDHSAVAQNAVTSIPMRTQVLFSQRASSQQEHEQNNLNISQHTNQGDNQNTERIGVQNSNIIKSPFLFSQKRNKTYQNYPSQASQTISEISKNSSDMTANKSGSKLLFTQKRPSQKITEKGSISNCFEKGLSQTPIEENRESSSNLCDKNDKVPNIVTHNISNDSGNLSHSGQEFTNIFSQSQSYVTQEGNRHQKFSIYQKNNDSFIRDKVILDKSANSKHTEGFNKTDISKLRESNKEELNIGCTDKKNMKLSDIVKSNNLMDFDIDFCFTNIKMKNTKATDKYVKNNSDHFKDDLNLSKIDEESGFGSQHRSNKSDNRESILEEPNNLTEMGTKINSRSENKETKAKSEDHLKIGKKRYSDSPPKSGKKPKKYCHQSKTTNEIDLLNLMPSVHDDFMKYDLNIDWDMHENDEHIFSQEVDEVEGNTDTNNREDDNLGYLGEKRTDTFNSNDGIKRRKSSDVIFNKLIDRKEFEHGDIQKPSKHSKILQVKKGEKRHAHKPWVDLGLFEFVPKEQREKENKEVDKREKQNGTNSEDKVKDRVVLKQNANNEKEMGANNTDIGEVDLINSSQNAPKPSNKFKFTNKTIVNKHTSFLENVKSDNQKSCDVKDGNSNSLIGGGSKLETKKEDVNPNFKSLVSNIDLNKEIRDFDFGSSIQNPFSKSLSKFSLKSSGSSANKEPEKNDNNGKNKTSNNFSQAKESGVISTTERRTKSALKSNCKNLDNRNIDLEPTMHNKICDVSDTNVVEKVGEKHELFDMTQNSRNKYISTKFSFKKLDIKRMSSSRSNSDDF